jgi:histidyl-tRNA synthetase
MGSNEIEKKECIIKQLATGKQETIAIDQLAAYLQ